MVLNLFECIYPIEENDFDWFSKVGLIEPLLYVSSFSTVIVNINSKRNIDNKIFSFFPPFLL